MFRKLLALVALAVVVWLGARYFAHRGEIKATLVFHEAGALKKGDPVVEDDQTIGRVTKITQLDGQDAVVVRLDRAHRRAIVTDSLFSVENRRIVVTNTFAVGKPIDDGAVLRAKDDRFSRWLARHANAVKPLVEKVKRAADEKLDAIDAELASAAAKVPDWKREGKDVFDKNVDALKKKIEKTEKDLKRSKRFGEAEQLRAKFERWLDEVGR
jgi:ABC-type transporter Mla subunit MlaD